MTHTDPEVTRIVRSWMEEGVTALPDRVLDTVLDQIPTTPQRRSWWPPRRSTDMNSPLKVVVGATAVIVVALVGINLLPGAATPSEVGQTPVPTLAPTSGPSAVPSIPVGLLDAGTYLVDDPRLTAAPFTITVPAGWYARSDGLVNKNGDTSREVGFFPFNVTHVYTDACKSEGTLTEIGPTVDDLVEALAGQEGSDASTPFDLAFGGYPAKRIDMSIPGDLDLSTCRHPQVLIQIWADPAENDYFAIPAEQVGMAFPAYIADVDGARAVILPAHGTDAQPSDIAELQAILDSITFQP